MNGSLSVHAMAPALRIYLVHTLRQTEDLMIELTFRVNTSVLFPATRSAWEDTMTATRRVITYIHNCQSDDDKYGFYARGFHGLCAIEAAQDALHSAVQIARTNTSWGSARARPVLTLFDHTSRAKSICNAIVALNSNDLELYKAWIQAAQFLAQTEEISNHRKNLCKDYIFNARKVGTSALVATESAEVVEVRRLAARFYRLAAALCHGDNAEARRAAFGAAEMYDKCVSVQKEFLAHRCERSEKLWQGAISFLRLAGDLRREVEKDVVLAEDAVASANKLVEAARDVPKLDAEQKKRTEEMTRAAAGEAAAKNSAAGPLWRALATELKKNYEICDKHLQALLVVDHHSVLSLPLPLKCDDSRIVSLKHDLTRIEASILATDVFKKKAQQSKTAPHHRLRALLEESWTLAATHMEVVVQALAEVVVNGVYKPLKEQAEKAHKIRLSIANDAVYVAESILGRAANHLDAARGAEAAGRHPSEAKYLRDAAGCLVELAEIICGQMREDIMMADVASLDAKLYLHGPYVDAKTKEETSLAKSATLVRQLHLYCQSAPLHHAARLSSLYDAATALEASERGVDTVLKVLRFVVACAEKLHTREVTDDEARLIDRGCLYAREACKSSAIGKWSNAYNSLTAAMDAFAANKKEKCALLSARAAIFECAAKTAASSSSYASIEVGFVYDFVAREITAALDSHTTGASDRLTTYRIALAARILTFCPVQDAEPLIIPEELRQLCDTCVPAKDIQAHITLHARAYRSKGHCSLQAQRPEQTEEVRAAWKEAVEQAETLVGRYQSKAKDLYIRAAHAYLPSMIVAQELALFCYLCAAVAASDGKPPSLWEKILARCNLTAELPHREVTKRLESVAATEELVRSLTDQGKDQERIEQRGVIWYLESLKNIP